MMRFSEARTSHGHETGVSRPIALLGALAVASSWSMACVGKDECQCVCNDPSTKFLASPKIASKADSESIFPEQLQDETPLAPPSASAETPRPPDPAAEVRRILQAAFDEPLNDQKLATFMTTLPMVGGKFVVEGDMLMDSEDLRDYLKARKGIVEPGDERAAGNGGRLLVKTWGSAPDYWRSIQNRKMVYVVDARSFDTTTHYDEVVENFAQAARQWETACPACGVSFMHDRKRDHNDNLFPNSNQSAGKLTFVVRLKQAQGDFVALSFFPHFAVRDRYVNIDPQYFDSAYDHVGIFIHEIGHILGYMHEHVRAANPTIGGCYKEKGSWKPLTIYDPHSTMHYWCDGGGTIDMKLTDLDIEGHKLLYIDGKWLE